jgi:NAD+ synthase (glutamine-hydrolysing)
MRDGGRAVEDFYLSPEIQEIKGQKSTKFGNAVIRCNDTTIACETCEELWVPKNPHVDYGLDGVEIIVNGSASHHELRKLHTRLGLITNASNRNGGVYVYANSSGCDGGRVYFDGSSMICMNGKIYSLDDQFSAEEVRVQLGVMDLDEVRSYRGGFNSRNVQSALNKTFTDIYANIDICKVTDKPLNKEVKLNLLIPEQEIAMGPPLWMWDYLRRSGARGFFLPLSGGADSASVAAMVASMA